MPLYSQFINIFCEKLPKIKHWFIPRWHESHFIWMHQKQMIGKHLNTINVSQFAGLVVWSNKFADCMLKTIGRRVGGWNKPHHYVIYWCVNDVIASVNGNSGVFPTQKQFQVFSVLPLVIYAFQSIQFIWNTPVKWKWKWKPLFIIRNWTQCSLSLSLCFCVTKQCSKQQE